MKNRTLIFLKPFTIKNPTPDEQNAFMMTEIVNEVECAPLGEIYNNDLLHDKELDAFIPLEVKTRKPRCVVAEGPCASVALGIRGLTKVLINPEVSYNHLNNVSELDRKHTYGFFDSSHERDYERFQSVFPNAAWFPRNNGVTLSDIKNIVAAIINEEHPC